MGNTSQTNSNNRFWFIRQIRNDKFPPLPQSGKMLIENEFTKP